MGHSYIGKGPFWGVAELNLECINREGVKYRVVMSNFFIEIERCVKLGVGFDLFGDFPGLNLQGYREVVRIREDGKVEVNTEGKRTVLAGARIPPRAGGTPPELRLHISDRPVAGGQQISAVAHVVQKSAPIYYTLGAAHDGIVYNSMVAWELYGPEVEDQRFLEPENLVPDVRRAGSGYDVQMTFKLSQPGHYRLRAATVDRVGHSTVAWKSLVVSKDMPSG